MGEAGTKNIIYIMDAEDQAPKTDFNHHGTGSDGEKMYQWPLAIK